MTGHWVALLPPMLWLVSFAVFLALQGLSWVAAEVRRANAEDTHLLHGDRP